MEGWPREANFLLTTGKRWIVERATTGKSWIVERGGSLYHHLLAWWFKSRLFRFYRRTRLWLAERLSPFRRLITRKRGWLSEAIDEATANARPAASLGKTLGYFDLPRSSAGVVMALIVAMWTVLALVSLALSYVGARVGLPTGTSLDNLDTTMWQVQAGIAALALPVLLFVVERSRDDPRAVFRSPEILLRDSYAYQVLAFSFVVVGHIGLDLAWFGSSPAVVLLDLALVGMTLLLAVYAYFKVVQLIMSSSLLRDRSIALAKERLADGAWRTGRRLKGQELLRTELERIGLRPWVFETEDDAAQLTVPIRTDTPRYLDDVDVLTLGAFLESLPRATDSGASTGQGLSPAPASTTPAPPEPSIWYFLDYGSLIRPPATPFLRFRRDAFQGLDDATVTSVVAACVHLRASDDF
jgi:hypothetical protein